MRRHAEGGRKGMKQSERTYSVLFLCTGNSARSVMAEAILSRKGAGRFRAFSAGSFPKGEVHPRTLALLESLQFDTSGFRSKSWDEYASPDAPVMDVIVTVCDSAAGEVCPIWPGQPVTAHWGFPDPAAFEGSESETRIYFTQVYGQIERRIDHLLNLPLGALDLSSLQRKVREIGSMKLDDLK